LDAMLYWFFRHRLLLLGALLVIAPLLIMYMAGSSRSSSGFLESTGGTMAGLSQAGTSGAVDAVDGMTTGLGTVFGMSGEIGRLRAENDELKGLVQTVRELADQNHELRQLLGLRESREDLTTVAAEVVARHVGTGFMVDRAWLDVVDGSQAAPAPGNAVITKSGLMGRITEIRGRFADVMLVSDYRSRVAGQVAGTGVIGTVIGSGRKGGYVARLQVSVSDPVLAKGAVVVTSGHDRVFPRGIEIGYILNPDDRRQSGTFMEYDVSLSVDPATVDVVMIVTEITGADALKAFEVK